ncbi:N-acetyltransferase family protein [Propionibacterium freudenreichii]|uniref:GNAT family N-acetyltransferase n=1 Tax=Propionibacterium freudenreichii TaxID=1744 RepID=UPI000543BAD0|nr:GNAT family N-acetyltransferase [Propionibacterium freudenreichii]MDN5961818.1 GNAT family N-acetyltransferase [Propionibacterium sp.]CEG93920.1 Acetyltransferase [Propionibacterium freudenreichii]
MTSQSSGAGFVRLAMPKEAAAIAAIQRESWHDQGLADELPGPAQIEQAWREAIATPPLAIYRVLIAQDDTRTAVRGFAAIGPSDDPDCAVDDALVGEFVVDPRHLHEGHGSRLLNAVVDTLRADGFVRATWWVATTDDPLRAFLEASGWAPDGAHREVGDEQGIKARQIRLHTALK